jgi:hypothetical protein
VIAPLVVVRRGDDLAAKLSAAPVVEPAARRAARG